jgi:hypothetical protein
MTMQVLYDITTGQVMQWQDTELLSYPALMANLAVKEVSEAQWNTQDHPAWVVNGALTAVDPTVHILPSRADLEDRVWTAIRGERDKRTQLGGCQVGASWFHTDTFSRSQWLGLKDQARDILAAGGAMTDPVKKLGSKVLWKTMGGTFVTVTVQLTFDVVGATGDSDARVFMQAEIHRSAMKASADPLAYDFSGGWPVNFEG